MYVKIMAHISLYGYTIVILCIFAVSTCYGDSLENVMDLHDALFVSSKYNVNVRGVADQTRAVRVAANFSLMDIGEVMEKEEAFSVMGLLYLSWKDDRLVWNPVDYNGTSRMVVYQDVVWKPEVKLANPLLSIHEIGVERSQIRVNSDGIVTWIIPDIFMATCTIDVVSFPWDRQVCSLEFIASAYLPSEVIMKAGSHQVGYYRFKQSQAWEVVKTSVVNEADGISMVIIWLCLDRRPSFHLAVVLAPITGLSFLNVFAFFVKVDSGERVSFSITLLLSITLYLSLVSDKLPSHSKGMPAIIYCLILVLTESMFICIMSIFSLHVYHKAGVPPVKYQRIVRKLLGRTRATSRCANDAETEKTVTEEAVPGYEVHKDEDAARNEDLGVTWLDVSLLMDRIFCFVASVAIFVFFVIFGVYVVKTRTECM